MATYYVRATGNDASAGTSAGAAWLTIGKALGAAGIASGDTLYVGAGTYRQCVTVNMTSATVETKVIGDVDGSHTGDAGDVVFTSWTTSYIVAPTNNPTLNLNGRDFLTFQNITFIGPAASFNHCVDATTATSTDITLTNCVLMMNGNGSCVQVAVGYGVAANWTLQNCVFMSGSPSDWTVRFNLARGAADYNITTVVKNCLFLIAGVSNYGFVTRSTGSGAGFGGGVTISNCTFLAGNIGVGASDASESTTYPISVYNSVFYGQSTCLAANTTGQVVEDYNWLYGNTARSNVTAGTHSQVHTAYACVVELGQALLNGRQPKLFFTPMIGSAFLGFGNQASSPTTDFLGAARPSGGVSANPGIGYLERGNTWAKNTGTVRTGSNALSITGAGYQDFDLPVDTTATTVTVYMRYDSTYAGTKPQIQVLNGTEAGVANATSSAVTTVNTWEALSLTFTPTSAGIVTIRLLSSDTNGGGGAFADDFSVA